MYRFYQRHGDPLNAAALRDQPWEIYNAGDPSFTDPLMSGVPLALRRYFEASSVGYLTTQTFVQEAATACALERFRLAQGKYPDVLEALVPNYLQQIPADLLVPTDAKLQYVRTPEGGFKLYSVGFNGVEDGGKPNPSNEGNSDLVWIQPGQR